MKRLTATGQLACYQEDILTSFFFAGSFLILLLQEVPLSPTTLSAPVHLLPHRACTSKSLSGGEVNLRTPGGSNTEVKVKDDGHGARDTRNRRLIRVSIVIADLVNLWAFWIVICVNDSLCLPFYTCNYGVLHCR